MLQISSPSAAAIIVRSIRREARGESARALHSGGGFDLREDQLVDRILRSNRLQVRNERIEAVEGGETSDEQLKELVEQDAVLWDGSPDLFRRRLNGRLRQVATRQQGNLASVGNHERLAGIVSGTSGGGGGGLPGARSNRGGDGVEGGGVLHDGDRCSGGDGDVVKVIRRASIRIRD